MHSFQFEYSFYRPMYNQNKIYLHVHKCILTYRNNLRSLKRSKDPQISIGLFLLVLECQWRMKYRVINNNNDKMSLPYFHLLPFASAVESSSKLTNHCNKLHTEACTWEGGGVKGILPQPNSVRGGIQSHSELYSYMNTGRHIVQSLSDHLF